MHVELHAPGGPGRLLGPQRGLAPGAAGRKPDRATRRDELGGSPRPRRGPGPRAAPRRGGAGAAGLVLEHLDEPIEEGVAVVVASEAAGDCTIFDRRPRAPSASMPRLKPRSRCASRSSSRAAAARARALDGARAARATPRLHGRADEADAGQAPSRQFVTHSLLSSAPSPGRVPATASSSAPRSVPLRGAIRDFATWARAQSSAPSAPVEIKILRRGRAESSRRPPRHRRDACSMAWRCRFVAARPSQYGRVIAEK